MAILTVKITLSEIHFSALPSLGLGAYVKLNFINDLPYIFTKAAYYCTVTYITATLIPSSLKSNKALKNKIKLSTKRWRNGNK